MSSIVKEVQALINTLGFLENDQYYPEPDYFQNVRDLIRYLHRDDRLFTIRRLCNERNIVKNDLVPMIRSKDCTDEIFDVALRITVNLCQPTFMLYNNKRPDGPAEWQLFHELETSLVRTLTAFTDERIFQIFAVKIDEYFDKDWEDRNEGQRLIIERIFVLIRYLFSIGIEGIGPNSVPEIDHSVRARIITNFFLSGIPEIFFKLSSIITEKEFCCYIVIILALIFKKLDPLTIAHEGNAELQKGDKEKLEKEQAKAIELFKAEEEEKRRKSNRRSFLAGSFVVKDMKPLNAEKDFVVNGSILEGKENSPIANLEVLSRRKKTTVRPKGRRVDNLEMNDVCTTEDLRNLNPETMLAIKQFCSRFILEGKYNRLMRTTKDMAFNGTKKGASSVSEFHLFTLSSFMIAFARHSHYSCQNITSTFSVEFFHQITSFLTDCFDKMKLDKQNIKNWALSAQYAVTAFKEVTKMLNFISNSIFEEDKEFFRDFCHQIFRVEEYRELATGILRHLFPAGTSHKMLQDLIIANHYFLHLMEKSVKLGELLKFQKKKRQKKQKKTQKRKHKEQKKLLEKTMKLNELDELWTEISEELSDVLDGKIAPNEDANPLNVLIRAEDEQLQEFAKLQIQLALRTRRICDAVGIYRNARVLWPEMGAFGYDHFTGEEEKLALSEIFHADMKTVSKEYIEAMKKAYGKYDDGNGMNEGEEEEEEANSNYGEDNEEEDGNKEGRMDEFRLNDGEADLNGTAEEVNFDFPGFVSSMAKPAVIDWYIFSFRQFRTNPMEVNLAIIKFFHRIAFDLKSPARLYLAKLFVVLKDIKSEVCRGTNGKMNRHNHPYFKLYEFGYYLLTKFFTNYEERGGGIIVCELLFSKTAKEAYEVEYGYGSMD